MPVSSVKQFYFALFLAPSRAFSGAGITPAFTDPNFQFTEAYQTNSSTFLGRLAPQLDIMVGASQGFFIGSTVDIIVRGWSENAGETWSEALASWNNGSPLVPMYIGSSSVGNDFVLGGGASPTPWVFGLWEGHQLPGLNMALIPEPSTLPLAFLGAAVLWARTSVRGLGFGEKKGEATER